MIASPSNVSFGGDEFDRVRHRVECFKGIVRMLLFVVCTPLTAPTLVLVRPSVGRPSFQVTEFRFVSLSENYRHHSPAFSQRTPKSILMVMPVFHQTSTASQNPLYTINDESCPSSPDQSRFSEWIFGLAHGVHKRRLAC